MTKALRVILTAPHISATATGEGFVAYKWAEALSQRVELTVLALQSPRHRDLAAQLPLARVVTWPEPEIFMRWPRFRAMFKPQWPIFSAHVRRYLRDHAAEFDLGHHLMPVAMRFESPFRHFNALPYVIGPVGGALTMPAGFKNDDGPEPLFTKLRALDPIRFRFDPRLRRSYARAAAVLGIAPYVREALQGVDLQRFESVLELGVEDLAPPHQPTPSAQIRLLHIGRGTRSKGLRDVIRAMALLPDLPLTLTSAGAGAEIDRCKSLAQDLGLAERVTFKGFLPRAEIEQLYASHDIFTFPSFREPSGNVLYEAMRWGLPIIAADRGGPQEFITPDCGLKLAVETPAQLARDLAQAIRQLAQNPDLRAQLGQGGRAKLAAEGLWPQKADKMVALYHDILARGSILELPRAKVKP